MVINIGTSCSPAKVISITEYDACKFIMSCGGGMGGSRWDEYVLTDIVNPFPSNTLIKCVNYLGEEIVLNTSYLVKATKCKIVEIVEDITAWYNYNKGTHIPMYKTTYFCVNPNDVINTVSKFTDYSDITKSGEISIIKQITAKTI